MSNIPQPFLPTTGLGRTLMEAKPALSNTVCRKYPAAYLASVSAKALARSVSPIAVFVSTIFFRICLHVSTGGRTRVWGLMRRSYPLSGPSLEYETRKVNEGRLNVNDEA